MANIFGKTVNNVVETVRNSVAVLGHAAVHSLAPEEIEYYMCSLELFDYNANSKAYLIFSVMPEDILDNTTPIASITKTRSGIVTNFSDSYMPRDISIRGNFGRKIKLLAGARAPETNPAQGEQATGKGFLDRLNGLGDFSNVGFSVGSQDFVIKSGYGLIKMLKQMVDLSWSTDSTGKPFIMVFNNYAFNTSDVVEILQHSYSQNQEMNMIWQYSLEMRTVAPGSSIGKKTRTNFLTTVLSGQIAKGLTNLINDVKRSIL